MKSGDKIEVQRVTKRDGFRIYGILWSQDAVGSVTLEQCGTPFNSVHYAFKVIEEFPWEAQQGVLPRPAPTTIKEIDEEIDKLKIERITMVADRCEELYNILRNGAYGTDDGGDFVISWHSDQIEKNHDKGTPVSVVMHRSLNKSRSLNKTGNVEELEEWASQIKGYLFDDLKKEKE